jgi:putative flippase GtrA
MEQPLHRRLLERLLSPRVWRFAAVGFSGVFVNLGVLYLFADVLSVGDVLSSAIAIEVSIIWNFILNNAWTFRDKNELARGGFISRLLRYNLVSLVGLGIQLVTFILLTSASVRFLVLDEPGIWKYPSQLAGIGIAMAWNFLSNFFWTWAQDDPVSEEERTSATAPAAGEPTPAPKEIEQP